MTWYKCLLLLVTSSVQKFSLTKWLISASVLGLLATITRNVPKQQYRLWMGSRLALSASRCSWSVPKMPTNRTGELLSSSSVRDTTMIVLHSHHRLFPFNQLLIFVPQILYHFHISKHYLIFLYLSFCYVWPSHCVHCYNSTFSVMYSVCTVPCVLSVCLSTTDVCSYSTCSPVQLMYSSRSLCSLLTVVNIVFTLLIVYVYFVFMFL